MGVMVGSRGYGDYEAAPMRQGRRRHHHWLRTARLNAVGWAALLGACLVAAAVGVAAAGFIAIPRGWGAVLGMLPLGALVLLDRRRWAAMEAHFGWGASEADVARIASELANQGVLTTIHTAATADAWGEPGDGWGRPNEPLTSDETVTTASLSYRNRDAQAVAATLRAHGIPFPEFP